MAMHGLLLLAVLMCSALPSDIRAEMPLKTTPPTLASSATTRSTSPITTTTTTTPKTTPTTTTTTPKTTSTAPPLPQPLTIAPKRIPSRAASKRMTAIPAPVQTTQTSRTTTTATSTTSSPGRQGDPLDQTRGQDVSTLSSASGSSVNVDAVVLWALGMVVVCCAVVIGLWLWKRKTPEELPASTSEGIPNIAYHPGIDQMELQPTDRIYGGAADLYFPSF